MSDEESLIQRFHRTFWLNFVGRFHSDLICSEPSPDVPVDAVITNLERLVADARSASVFLSSNEDSDDCSSTSILFSVLPFAIGNCMYHHTPYVRETRKQRLSVVKRHWDEFSSYCIQLGLRKRTVPASREAKIEALRRSTILKPAIMKVFRYSDLDEVREEVIDMVEYFSIQCEADLRFVNEELQLLSVDTQEVVKAQASAPPQKPWTVKLDKSNIRSLMASKVFQPDIAMPTMSLAEFADQEMKHMQASNSQVRTPEIEDEDDEDFYRKQREEDAKEAEKARNWDDWKDDNPRGAGNKMMNMG